MNLVPFRILTTFRLYSCCFVCPMGTETVIDHKLCSKPNTEDDRLILLESFRPFIFRHREFNCTADIEFGLNTSQFIQIFLFVFGRFYQWLSRCLPFNTTHTKASERSNKETTDTVKRYG